MYVNPLDASHHTMDMMGEERVGHHHSCSTCECRRSQRVPRTRLGLHVKMNWTKLLLLGIWSSLLLSGSVLGEQAEQVIEIVEEQDYINNTYVGRIGAGIADMEPPFEFTPLSSEVNKVFQVDGNTGVISLKGRLDREEHAIYKLFAINSNLNTLAVTIRVLDINDNSPVFPKEEIFFEFLEENTPANTKQPLGSIVDSDDGINGLQDVAIVEGNVPGLFDLDKRRQANGKLYVDFVILEQLDYEDQPSYRLKLEAWDGGSPRRTAHMYINVSVIDANDHRPMFTVSHYSAQVMENATIGTSVLQVAASDMDSGENGRIEYSIQAPEVNFDINNATGLVFVNKALDYETKSVHNLVVIARDNGVGEQKSQTTAVVSIEVFNVNDNPPQVRHVFTTPTSTNRVSEVENPPTYIAVVTVTDPDQIQDPSKGISVTLNGGDNKFVLEKTETAGSYHVSLAENLDRETKSLYHLVIIAIDQGVPPLSTNETLTIEIGDVNDNEPVFAQSTYYADIQEVVPPGSSVIQLTADDADLGNNSVVRYSLKNTPQTHSDWFQVENRTGLITTKSRVDCETASQPVLSVVASNVVSPFYSTTATVIVRIRDVNDNQPIFDQSFYNVTVSESAAVDSCILVVSASDPDCGTSPQLQYSISTTLGFQLPAELRVMPSTGEVCITKPLDYETTSTYDFPVVARDQDGLDATAMVKVVVLDVNDNRPAFYPSTYTVNLEEDTSSNTEVVVVRATDKDTGVYGTLQYSISSGNTLGIFSIDRHSGVIRLLRSLPSSPRHYTLGLSAEDGGGLQASQPAQVMVNVVDPSQHPPEFTVSLYSFSVPEDADVDQTVGQVEATSQEPGSVSYSITSDDGNVFFRVQPHTGVLYVAKDLDHETVPWVLLNIQAQIGSPVSYGQAQVNVTISDINDNYPEFKVAGIQISVKEDVDIGSTVYMVEATDADSKKNGEVHYQIDDQSGTFTVDENTGQIKLQKSLDHERRIQHNFSIKAHDMGVERLQSTLSVSVNVLDVNDNPPVFPHMIYTFTVSEAAAVDTRFAQVSATDADSGNNGRLTYLLQNTVHMDKFRVFADDGGLYTQAKLDHEEQSQYQLQVVVVDNGIPPLSASTQVVVTIEDSNDNTPEFIKDEYLFDISENLPPQSPVGFVSAEDADHSDHLSYSLLTGQEWFIVEPDSGELLTNGQLDRETREEYEVSVGVNDQGNPPRSATVQVVVRVLDENDNSPHFVQSGHYVADIIENSASGSTVLHASANDKDNGLNGTVQYFMLDEDDPDSEFFSIDITSGEITTTEVLDRETKSQFVFKIIAQDRGVPARSTTKTVEVYVIDTNESAPVPDKDLVYITVDETAALGTIVGRVKARDSDAGANGRVVYYITKGNVFGTFRLNSTTGEIYIVRPIDYEESPSYVLRIYATDSSPTEPLSSIIVVNITVKDINDNAPEFDKDIIVIPVRENVAVGTHVYTLTAEDKDGGNFGKVEYSIDSVLPATHTWFTIDANTGMLRVGALIDYEEIKDIIVVVRASDKAPPESRLSNTVTIQVLVQDVNDHSPVFQSRPICTILEDEPVSYPLTHLIASDEDSHDNARITYSIITGNELNHFRLNVDTGLLTVVKMLDRELVDQFILNVSASDHGQPPRVTYSLLTVHVADVNDNPPSFQHSVYMATVREERDVGSYVTRITATDADIEDNAKMSYLIPSGIAGDQFIVNSSTGVVSTNAILDRELYSNWLITAYVKDGAFPALYDTTTIHVTVEDVNDNTPQFTDLTYELSIPENAQLSVIHTVKATDADTGLNGHVTYSIIGGNTDNKFSLDSSTGKLSCSPLDRETTTFYNLTVLAEDGGSPPLVNRSSITITVRDDNDNDPHFKQSLYTKEIPEDFDVGKSILKVEAFDVDQGDNARILYSVNNTTGGMFKIDNITGIIVTAGSFDREKKDHYSFEVHATDGGLYGPRSESVRVDITITDVNDNSPVFTEFPYVKSIAESQTGCFMTVKAEDKDEGQNSDIFYHLESNPYFSMNTGDGQICIQSRLEPDDVRIHKLSVTATDDGSPPRTSTSVVKITVGNVQHTGNLRFTNKTYTVNLIEGPEQDSLVVRVHAEFAEGVPGQVAYSFAGGNDDDTFSINPTSGDIRVKNPQNLDYETDPRLRLIVVAMSSDMYDYTRVWIQLKDVNDNRPVFLQDRYTSAVWESNTRDTYVTQVVATDADEGENGKITYNIVSGNINDAFVVSPPNTGIVKTNFYLDREIRSSYRLEIEAVDNGRIPMSSTCTLKIQVIDINDNAPFFPQYPDYKIKEGAELGTFILQVTANDVDLNPILEYTFAPNGNPEGTFDIELYSGRITLAKPLDYEHKPRYTLLVQGSDKKHVQATTVVILVQDENDNTPTFSQQSYEVALPELTKADYSVITVQADDDDDGENARITYSMLTVDGFHINTQTGTIYTNRTVVFNPSQPTIHLVVTAKDHGTPALSTVVPVRVQVIDVNDHAPEFTESHYVGSVKEDAAKGTVVLSVLAYDKDDSYNNTKVEYRIVVGNQNGVFQMEPSTGDLVLVGELDREIKGVYNLWVEARDHGETPMSSSVTVQVNILDVNDNSPNFTEKEYHQTVDEDLPVGASVLKVEATDIDADDNARVEYQIASGNDLNCFEIDRDTGVIGVRILLDYETQPRHRMIVQAMDKSRSNPRSALVTVIVNVLDVNEFTPKFVHHFYYQKVAAQQKIGTHILTVVANDKDGGQFKELEYKIDGQHDKFKVDPLSGDITTAVEFEYDADKESNRYQFNVEAEDKGGLSATVVVMIEIVPKTTPSFEKRQYNFQVNGDAKVGDVVGVVQAAYRSDGPKVSFSYKLQPKHDYFAINATKGVIYVIKALMEDEEVEQSAETARRKRHAKPQAESGEIQLRSRRRKRTLDEDNVRLTVVATADDPARQVISTTIELTINRTCEGCGVTPLPSSGDSWGGTYIVLGIVIAILVLVFAVAAVVYYHRRRDHKRHPTDTRYGSSCETIDAPPPVRTLAPPPYNQAQNYPRPMHDIPTSEISDQSHSASSGRGSAEEDEDEEIRMINATPLQGQLRVPDSGMQDDDAISELSAPNNHQEYLARLGIDTTKIKATAAKSGVSTSVESMHQFSDEGGGEESGMDIGNLVYDKLGQVEADENMAIMDGTRQFDYGETEPSSAGSLSSIINSEEEFSGSYNWDYLLDWGPQYQPLAHVFAEIARLKDDNIKPKTKPTHIVPQRLNLTSLNPQVRMEPPPFITDAPPTVANAGGSIKPNARTSQSRKSSSSASSNTNTVNSARTSQLTSVSLPKSPISYESSFTSTPMSPSFTPSLSPLATRSPSISPLVTPKGMGSSSSGHNTPPHRPHPVRAQVNRDMVTVAYGRGGSPCSDQEFQI